MYCPWCGKGLTTSANGQYLECQSGNMGLSKHLEARLREVYELEEREPKQSPNDRSDGWFCPKCSHELVLSVDGAYRCPTCARTIGEFTYEIVEFHPHEAAGTKLASLNPR